jgi:hypothetical protein
MTVFRAAFTTLLVFLLRHGDVVNDQKFPSAVLTRISATIDCLELIGPKTAVGTGPEDNIATLQGCLRYCSITYRFQIPVIVHR